MDQTTIVAALLGLLEGLTEFLPVSSTGHVLLAGHFLGFESTGKAFEVVIQLGAILAILGVYAKKLVALFAAAPHDPQARQTIYSVAIAFAPAVVIGVMAHGFIKAVLFESPFLIAVMLVLGGVVLVVLDKLPLKERYGDAMHFPLGMSLKIGFIQCLAMVPGVSRSGATIVGAMMMGASKRAAAEFSFFLSMPTMAGAFAYDLYKNRDVLSVADLHTIAVGFVFAFFAAVLVVRGLLAFVSKHGYAMFGWWRIIIGTLVLLAIAAGY